MRSYITYIACIVLLLYVAIIFRPKWVQEKGESSLGYDAATYYWYLPATFIYKDLKHQAFGDSIIAKYGFTSTFDQSYMHESGNRVITYSSGVAVLQLPAFAIAHVLAKPFGYPADGFSKPYQVAIQLWGLFWVFVGLWYFRKLLLLYFSDTATAVTLLLLVFGTNYLNYNAIDVTLTHSWLFTIYVLLMLNTREFYLQPSRKYAVKVGLLMGMLVLIRPSEIVGALLPLLWGMESISLKAIKNRLAFYATHNRHLLIAILCTVLVGSIQIVYWLYVTGQPFVYSYDDKGFSWLAPHTWQYLTSYNSGWVMYNPAVLFIFIGIIPFLKYGRNKVAILTFFIMNLYIVSAWDIWWYSGLGGRAMVQSYAVILLPAATLIEYILSNKILKWVVVPFFLLFAYINLWVIYNAHTANSLYDSQYMSRQYYWAVIGRWNVSNEVLKLQDTENIYTGKLYNKELIYENHFESEQNVHPHIAVEGERSLYVKARSNSAQYKTPCTANGKKWVRLQCTYKCFRVEWDLWSMFRTRMFFIHKGNVVKEAYFRPQRFLWDTGQRTIHYDVLLPDAAFDTIEITFLNENSNEEMLVDELKLWTYNEK